MYTLNIRSFEARARRELYLHEPKTTDEQRPEPRRTSRENRERKHSLSNTSIIYKFIFTRLNKYTIWLFLNIFELIVSVIQK